MIKRPSIIHRRRPSTPSKFSLQTDEQTTTTTATTISKTDEQATITPASTSFFSSSSDNINKVKKGEGTHWLTRVYLLNFLAFIYFIAFLVAFHQNVGLLGENGLTPAANYLHKLHTHTRGEWCVYKSNSSSLCIPERFYTYPTFFWFTGATDMWLQLLPFFGMCLSLLALSGYGHTSFIFFLLWCIQHSIHTVGQKWYAFGWENQLLESGFLAIFLPPFFSFFPSTTTVTPSSNPSLTTAITTTTATTTIFPSSSPPSRFIIWLFRWFIFRIMLGAGLIKIRAGGCWLDFTCMNFFYETQPLPNPVSWFLHFTPLEWHKVEVLINHIVELGVCWLALFPHRNCCVFAGVVLGGFQCALIYSGNLSFLNWLTILPCLACFDDKFWMRIGPKRWSVQAREAEIKWQKQTRWSFLRCFRLFISFIVFCLIMFLSIPVIENLLSPQQTMNTNFGSLCIVNTYGAFGHVGKERYEVILEATHTTNLREAKWIEYVFKCKPGPLDRRPCMVSPYQYRLDWVIWFAGFPPHNYVYHPWIVHLMVKLLKADSNVLALMEHSKNEIIYSNVSHPLPTFIRARLFKYQFAPSDPSGPRGLWWSRTFVSEYVPALSLGDSRLNEFLEHHGWTG